MLRPVPDEADRVEPRDPLLREPTAPVVAPLRRDPPRQRSALLRRHGHVAVAVDPPPGLELGEFRFPLLLPRRPRHARLLEKALPIRRQPPLLMKAPLGRDPTVETRIPPAAFLQRGEHRLPGLLPSLRPRFDRRPIEPDRFQAAHAVGPEDAAPAIMALAPDPGDEGRIPERQRALTFQGVKAVVPAAVASGRLARPDEPQPVELLDSLRRKQPLLPQRAL